MVGRYRQRPVVVEAMRLDLDNAIEVARWCGGEVRYVGFAAVVVAIPATEDHVGAEVGDYVLRDARGEFSACEADLFDATYEVVVDDLQ